MEGVVLGGNRTRACLTPCRGATPQPVSELRRTLPELRRTLPEQRRTLSLSYAAPCPELRRTLFLSYASPLKICFADLDDGISFVPTVRVSASTDKL